VFFATYTPRQKTDLDSLLPQAAKLYEVSVMRPAEPQEFFFM
jgi:hypothetical protein